MPSPPLPPQWDQIILPPGSFKNVRIEPCLGDQLQLYELRSSRNWGIGDFEDLSVTAGSPGLT